MLSHNKKKNAVANKKADTTLKMEEWMKEKRDLPSFVKPLSD